MSISLDGLQVRIGLVDGSEAKFFTQDEKEARQILDGIVPSKFFGQPALLIGGGYSCSLYPTAAVTHVTFSGSPAPKMPEFPESSEMTGIGREAFVAAVMQPKDKKLPRVREVAIGEVVTGIGRFGLRGGGRIYVEFKAPVAGKLDRRHFVQRMLNAACYPVARPDGFILINPACMISFGMMPGPADLPANAWLMRHLND